MPTTDALLKPKSVDTETHKMLRKLKNARTATYYDRYAKDLEALEEGDSVRMRPMTLNNKEWKKGTVVKRVDERSYEVETDQGILRRNRIDIRQTNEKIQDHGVESREERVINDKEDEKNDTTEERESKTTADLQDEKSVEEERPKDTAVNDNTCDEQISVRRSRRNIKKPNRLDL